MAEYDQGNLDKIKNKEGVYPPSMNRDDRELRIKQVKERQNEERQRKLEEIKSQALAAQKFKEQKEQERRLRMEEMRVKDVFKRQQVEERKRAINDAERDRLESILRRNQEREARMESKKRNERSSMVFAFGSSTPRMLDPVDTIGTFWGHRRATSTQNIMCSVPFTRRQSERETDVGSKKRATSAGGLECSSEGTPTIAAGCASGYLGRRRTDLMPTIPSRERDAALSATPRKSFARSPASSRPSSSLSHQSASSVTSSVNLRTKPIAAPRRPRPASIAVTGISVDKNGTPEPKKQSKPPLPKTRHSAVRKSQEKLESTPKKTENKKKKHATATSPSTDSVQHLPVMHSPLETKTIERVIESVELSNTEIEREIIEESNETTKENEVVTENLVHVEQEEIEKIDDPSQQLIDNERTVGATNEITPNANGMKEATPPIESSQQSSVNDQNNKENTDHNNKNINNVEIISKDLDNKLSAVKDVSESKEISDNKEIPHNKDNSHEKDISYNKDTSDNKEFYNKDVSDNKEMNSKDTNVDVANSLEENAMTKSRITTEEEAKAALAERRRLAREEAERQAEIERLKREEEARIEFERQQQEEEAQRLLIEQQRAAEQERLQEAIRETQRKEEEERQRKEEEQRLKLLKEEAERKAREEAEKQKIELQERLKNEEKEREARRKRVEAIMLRTRGKNNMSTPQQSEDKSDETTKMNGSKISTEISSENNAEITQKNGKDVETVDNLIPVDSLKNANTVNIESLSTDDTLNSNNAWQHNKTDLLM